jgi:hypothetical protein
VEEGAPRRRQRVDAEAWRGREEPDEGGAARDRKRTRPEQTTPRRHPRQACDVYTADPL